MPKQEGIKRILIVGDSYIWGDGYSNANHIWWKQFKHLLKEEGYNNVEIIAAGRSGYNTNEQLEHILKDREAMKIIDPDFIIMTYVENDTEITGKTRDLFVEPENFNVRAKIPYITALQKVFPASYMKVSRLITTKFFESEEFAKIFGINYNNWLQILINTESMKVYDDILNELNTLITKELDTPYIYYITVEECKEYLVDNIKEYFNKYNIEHYWFLEIAEKYGYEFPKGENKINPQNYHPSVETAKLYAKCLLKVLQEEHPEVLGEKNASYKPEFIINDWMPYNILPNKISDNLYEITYPKKVSSNSFLYLPVKKDYIKLNLEDPIYLKEISIEGEQLKNIKNATIWLNIINEKLGYDDQVMIEIPKEDENLVWKINENVKVTSININLELIKNEELKFKLKVR